MDQLRAMVKRWARSGICWLGEIGDVRDVERPAEVARRAGLTPPEDFAPARIDGAMAARVLAYGLHESLVHGRPRFRLGVAREAALALRDLGPGAAFWADTAHTELVQPSPASVGMAPFTLVGATFEVGVIAATQNVGFLWWRGEED